MKIAIYSRKSKYTGKGDSIENQIQMCKDYAETKFNDENREYYIFEDEGFTGSNLNRPRFKELMNNINNYDVLICYRLDRISRNVADFSSTLEILQDNKCDFISLKEQFDTSTPMGRAMIYIASVFAQLERETIAERVKDNMLELAKNGKWSGGRRPLGFSSENTTYIDDEGKERKIVHLVKEPEELELVKLIYDTYLKEGSLNKTEIWFTQQGIKSKSGILLEKTTLKLILQNPVYVKANDNVLNYLRNDGWNVYGEADGIHSLLSYNKTESVSSNGKITKRIQAKENWLAAMSSVEGTIDADTWLKVQKQFYKNKDTFPRLGKTHNAILTSKLRCKNCGNYMLVQHGHTSSKTGEKAFYYVCSMKKRSKGELCKSRNTNVKEIETAVINEMESLGKDRKRVINNFKKANKKATLSNNYKTNKTVLEQQIKDKEKQINNLIDKLSLDDSIANLLINKIKSYKEELEKLKSEVENINKNIINSDEEEFSISFVESLLNRCTDIKKLSKEEQKHLINVLVDTIYYDGEKDEVDLVFVGFNEVKKN